MVFLLFSIFSFVFLRQQALDLLEKEIVKQGLVVRDLREDASKLVVGCCCCCCCWLVGCCFFFFSFFFFFIFFLTFRPHIKNYFVKKIIF
jgi:hypothetical protein